MKLSLSEAQQKYNAGKLVIENDAPDLPKLREVTGAKWINGDCRYCFSSIFCALTKDNTYASDIPPANIEIVKLSDIGEDVKYCSNCRGTGYVTSGGSFGGGVYKEKCCCQFSFGESNTKALQNQQLYQNSDSQSNKIGEGVKNQFEIDEDKYYESFYSHECGCDGVDSFYYDRTVANGEVWHCTTCNTEIMTPEKPNPDNSKYFTPTPNTPEQTPISRGQGKGNQSIADAGDGWVKIENIKDLPKSVIDCWFIHKKSNDVEVGVYAPHKIMFAGVDSDFGVHEISHYQPIIKPKPPTQSLSK